MIDTEQQPAEPTNGQPKKRPPANWHGKPGKSGPPNNSNAASTGLYLRHGKYLPGEAHLARRVKEFERWLENATRQRYGEIAADSAGAINTAARAELRYQRLAKLLGEAATLADKIKIIEAQGSATEARDRAIKSLGLSAGANGNGHSAEDDGMANFWRAYDAAEKERQAREEAAAAAKAGSDAADGPEALNGFSRDSQGGEE